MYNLPTRLLAFIFFCVSCITANADTYKNLPNVSVGVLKYGTVNWEISVIKNYQ
jgi:hypothetical protein